jgi:hypothetical protein
VASTRETAPGRPSEKREICVYPKSYLPQRGRLRRRVVRVDRHPPTALPDRPFPKAAVRRRRESSRVRCGTRHATPPSTPRARVGSKRSYRRRLYPVVRKHRAACRRRT